MENIITQIIAEELDVPESAVVPEATILEGLASDSLDTVYLILSLEEKFNIIISDEEAATIKTVRDLFQMVKSKFQPPQSLDNQLVLE